jgi:hypothetical protein
MEGGIRRKVGTLTRVIGVAAAFALALQVLLPLALRAQRVPGAILACANKATGVLRQLSDAAVCNTALENPVSWGSIGPRGSVGPFGPAGPAGPAGPRGEPGHAHLYQAEDLTYANQALPDVEDVPDGNPLSLISLPAGDYFILATVNVYGSDIIQTNSATARCWIDVDGTVTSRGTMLDDKYVHGLGGVVFASRFQTVVMLQGATRVNSLVAIRCHDFRGAQMDWERARINALSVTDVAAVSLGGE